MSGSGLPPLDGRGCPSELTLDLLHLGTLKEEAKLAAAAHVAGCAHCTQAMASRAQGFAAHPEVDPRRMLAAIRRGGSEPEPGVGALASKLWRWLAGGVAVAALASLFIVVQTNHDAQGPEESTRSKGGPVLHVFRSTGEASSGERFKPGEPLVLRIDLPAASWTQILGLDASGKLYPIWPASSAEHREAGSGQAVPGAISLDESPGDETFFLVACAAGAPACMGTEPGKSLSCGEGCRESAFVLRRAR